MENYNKTFIKYNVEYYMLDELIHRTDGPAVIYPDESHHFYLFDERLPFKLWLINVEATPTEKTYYLLMYG